MADNIAAEHPRRSSDRDVGSTGCWLGRSSAATLSAETARRLLALASEQLARLFGLQVILATRAALGVSGNVQPAVPEAGLPRYLTVRQAAERTGFEEPYIQALCRANKLPGAHKLRASVHRERSDRPT